jgi:2-desacetyl-2-hydroxyethyl bacteriochlorophyllide A dehydrogenase
MRAIVATKPGVVEVHDGVPDPSVAPGHVVVAVRACGICGGDVDDFLHPDNAPSNLPLIPGHEAWGEVAEVGDGVDRSLVGTPVAIDPSLLCGHCRPCREGRGNVCENRGAIGVTEPGAWAEFVPAPVANLHRLEDDRLSGRLPVLIEPMACALYGLERLEPRPGQRALIFGAGTMGLLLALLIEDAGAEAITVVEPNARRRALVSQLTSAVAIEPGQLTDERAELVIDASGNIAAFEAALARVDDSGRMLLFGLAPKRETITVEPYALLKRDISLVTAFAIRNTFVSAVETVARLAPVLGGLVTHEFPLAEHPDAFAMLRDGSGVKVALTPGSSAG